MKADILKLLDLFQHCLDGRIGIIDVVAELLGLVEDIAAPRKIRNEHALPVADDLGARAVGLKSLSTLASSIMIDVPPALSLAPLTSGTVS